MSNETEAVHEAPVSVTADPPVVTGSLHQPPSTGQKWKQRLAFRRISGIYIFVVIFAIFAIRIPDTFLTTSTWSSLLSEQAVTTLVAVGLVVALASGVFDLSVGAVMGCSAAVTAYLVVNSHWSVWPALAASIVFGLLVGCLNALVVVKFRVDSFIGTLGMQSVLYAILLWVTNGQQIVGLPSVFLSMAYNKFLGIPLPFYIMLVVAFGLWYMMELTPLGRFIEATGGNRDAARLAGVPTTRLMSFAFLMSAVVAALAGVVLLSRVSGAAPNTGADYVLPVFAAAFLGRTQFRPGRFNIWGTVLAVYLLAMITKGLQLEGAQPWLTNLFYGVALILAVSLSNVERRQRVNRMSGGKADDPAGGAAEAGSGAAPAPTAQGQE